MFVVYLYANVNRDQYLQKYKYAITKAETLAPNIPEVNFAKSSYLITVKHDKEAAIKEIEIASLKRPNDYDFLNLMAGLTGDLKLAEKVYQLNPKSMEVAEGNWGRTFGEEKYIEAESWADRMIAINLENALGYERKAFLIIDVWGDMNRGEDILKEARQKVTMEKWRLTYDEYRICMLKRDYNRALKIDLPKEYLEWEFYCRAILLRLMNKNNEARDYF